jgi:hypothetical protein
MVSVNTKLVLNREGLTFAGYAMHGGAFPIVHKGTGPLGSIVASGLHQRVDHSMVVDAIITHLNPKVPHLEPQSRSATKHLGWGRFAFSFSEGTFLKEIGGNPPSRASRGIAPD